VISAQWSVSDAPTSLLMFMVHHFMREEELPPVDALREAQLWMIGDRQPPDTMPAELRRHLDSPAAADLASWAAFSHFGR
jgi:CHAT domain-containing protein